MIDEDGVRRCSVEGCGRVHFAKGLCNAHYRRLFVNKKTDYDSDTIGKKDEPYDFCMCETDIVVVAPCSGIFAENVQCYRCYRPVLETMGITWTRELLLSHRIDPRVPEGLDPRCKHPRIIAALLPKAWL